MIRLVSWISRLQSHVIAPAIKPLDGGIIAINQRHDRLAVSPPFAATAK
jgi:hypothetical protein